MKFFSYAAILGLPLMLLSCKVRSQEEQSLSESSSKKGSAELEILLDDTKLKFPNEEDEDYEAEIKIFGIRGKCEVKKVFGLKSWKCIAKDKSKTAFAIESANSTSSGTYMWRVTLSLDKKNYKLSEDSESAPYKFSALPYPKLLGDCSSKNNVLYNCKFDNTQKFDVKVQ